MGGCNIALTVQPHEAIVRVQGDLDMSTVGSFQDCLDIAIQTGTPTVEIDFADCSFLSVAGLRVVIVAAEAITRRGGRLVITHLSRPVAHIVRLSEHVTGRPLVFVGEVTDHLLD